MSDPLADLKRRAYARPTSAADAAEAQAELARIQEQQHAEIGWRTPSTHLHTFGRTRVAVAGLAILAALGALASTAPPGGSLAVFDRAQNPDDLTAPGWAILSAYESPQGADGMTIRWLADFGGVRLYAYRTIEGLVCLSLVHGMGTRRSCTSAVEFADSGIILAYGTTGTIDPALTVVWGPNGSPMFYEGPVPAAGRP